MILPNEFEIRTRPLGFVDGAHDLRPLSILLNLLCLDAPLVAVAWQWIFAFTVHAPLTMANRLALFLTAWLIYLIDRFVDSISLSPNAEISARQKFCRDHRRLWLCLIIAAAVADLFIAFAEIDRELLMRGFILALVAAAYLVLNLRLSRIWEIVPAKEICVGLLFAAGTLLALSVRIDGRSTIAFAAALFAAVCVLNCISIAFWERDLDQAQRKHSIATRWPRAKPLAKIALIIIALFSLTIAIVDASVWRVGVCLSVSAVLLFAVDYLRVGRDTRTALADVVLLTPLILYAIEKIG